MNNGDITNTMIRDFLLGGLDEAATERLDELSITDAAFADRLSIERYELIDEWVAGRLDVDDRKRFEAVLARSPTMREKVEVGRRLAATAPTAVVAERPSERSRIAAWFGGWPRLAYGIAGLAILITIFGLGVYLLRRDSGPEMSQVAPPVTPTPPASPAGPTPVPTDSQVAVVPTPTETPANVVRPDPTPVRRPVPAFTAIVLAPPMRGATTARSVKLEQGVEFLHLTLQTEASASGRFAVEIGDVSGGTDWRSAVIRGRSANGRTNVFVRVPAARLKNGVRSVRLIDAGSGSEVLDEHAIKIER